MASRQEQQDAADSLHRDRDERPAEEDRDQKRVRRSGFGDAPEGGDQPAGAGGPPAPSGELDFAKAVKEAAARAAALLGASGGALAARPPVGGGYPAPAGAPSFHGGLLPGGNVVEVILAHPDACGKVIGRGGETISTLQATTGASIKVQSNNEVMPGQQRRITLSGPPAAVAAAKKLVEEALAEPVSLGIGLSGQLVGLGGQLPPAGSFASAPPGTLLPIACAPGFMPPRLMLGSGADDGPGEVVAVTPDMIGRVIGRGGETIRRLQDDSGARIQVERDQGQVRIKGSASSTETAKRLIHDLISGSGGGGGGGGGMIAYGGGGGGGGGGMGGGGGGGGISISVQSHGQEGRIIGRGGETIREIQARSGARVQIDRAAGVVNISAADQRSVDEAVRQVTELVNTGREMSGRGGGGGGGGGGGYGAPPPQQYGDQQPQYGSAYQGGGYGGGYVPPAAGGYGAAVPAGGYGGGYGGYAPPQQAPPQQQQPLWTPQTSNEGHTYWYNTQTGESAWEKPQGA